MSAHAEHMQNESVKRYEVTRARRSAWVQPVVLLNAVVRTAAASSTSLYSLMIEVSARLTLISHELNALVYASDREHW